MMTRNRIFRDFGVLISHQEIGAPSGYHLRPDIIAARKAHRARFTKTARNIDGKLRNGLYRVRPRIIENHERDRFRDFLHLERPFVGDYTVIIHGYYMGDYAFVEKQDAALFKLFWA
jgi:hypothetical protein